MKRLNNTKSNSYENGGGKMNLRYFFSEYKSVVLFGVILAACVVVSYVFSPLIPLKIYSDIIQPIQYTALITFCFGNVWIVSRHTDGTRMHKLVVVVMAAWTVLMSLGFYIKMRYGTSGVAEGLFSMHGWELVFGNVFALLLLAYPTELLRPGWLTFPKVVLQLLPPLAAGSLGYWLDIDLRCFLVAYPLIMLVLLIRHIRAYRIWCEENYSSMDDIDVQWVWKYMVMVLISGLSYIYLCFSTEPTYQFTQMWLLFFILFISTEQILFRPDPWQTVRNRAKQASKSVKSNPKAVVEPKPEPEPESDAQDDAQIASEETNAANRAILEEWIATEKPYCSPDFRLEDLRVVLPLNRSYLSGLINAEYGCNFYQYVTRHRIEEAKRLLKEQPELKIQEVAEQCGFSSSTMFGRVFARETGFTPTEWVARNEKA